MRVVSNVIIAWVMLYIPLSHALDYSPMTAQEVKMLPDYFCMMKYRADHGERDLLNKGRALMGPQFENVHHYCYGLNDINRYYLHLGEADAASYLHLAVNEFTYMVDHPKPNSTIRANIFLQRGIAYSLWRRYSEAAIDLQQAITLNPKLVQAYIRLADNYANINDRDNALSMVSEGLRHIPESKALKRRYDELGGKQPYPEALVATPTPQPTESQEKPTAPVTAQAASEKTAAVKESEPGAAQQQKTGTTTPPSGTSKNRYCRFCAE
jgi:tetratricopeptide (TPR) repeat protein